MFAPTSASQLKEQRFAYGADGQRIAKATHELGDNQAKTRTHYIRDAQGNVMATYRHERVPTWSFRVTERTLYGSSRLGVDNLEAELCYDPQPPPYDPTDDPAGRLRYEMTDHLGNVITVVTDELLGVNTDGIAGYEYFQPLVVTAQGYEPFGSLLPGRNYSSDSYRFSLNGQEKDDEIYDSPGTSMNAEFWQYDTRSGRRWNLDPKGEVGKSFYSAFSNSPLYYSDPNGDRVRGSKRLVREFKESLRMHNPKTWQDNWKSFKRDKITWQLASISSSTEACFSRTSPEFERALEVKGAERSMDNDAVQYALDIRAHLYSIHSKSRPRQVQININTDVQVISSFEETRSINFHGTGPSGKPVVYSGGSLGPFSMPTEIRASFNVEGNVGCGDSRWLINGEHKGSFFETRDMSMAKGVINVGIYSPYLDPLATYGSQGIEGCQPYFKATLESVDYKVTVPTGNNYTDFQFNDAGAPDGIRGKGYQMRIKGQAK